LEPEAGLNSGARLRSPGVRRWSLFDKIGSGSAALVICN